MASASQGAAMLDHVRAATLCAATLAGLSAAGPVAAAVKPNIVMVLTDDQTGSLIDQMPNIKSLVRDNGATFTHAYYNDPLCQPSRATILTGRYNQNTRAVDNTPSAYQSFRANAESDNVGVWLKAAGYKTALVGKYMNGYAGSTRIPPGWDYWAPRAGGTGLYYNYKVNENGTIRSYGTGLANYSTTVWEKKALAFLNTPGVTKSPFLLMVAPNAPHVPSDALSADLSA